MNTNSIYLVLDVLLSEESEKQLGFEWQWVLVCLFLEHEVTPYASMRRIRRYFQHAHFISIVGVGKRGAY